MRRSHAGAAAGRAGGVGLQHRGLPTDASERVDRRDEPEPRKVARGPCVSSSILPTAFLLPGRVLTRCWAVGLPEPVDDLLTPWPELWKEVGFDAYYEQEARYAGKRE